MYTAQLTIERIQSLIKEKGLTQKQVLSECSINENTLKRMTDNKGISSFYLAKIADILECSVDYLLGRTDDPCINRIGITTGDINNSQIKHSMNVNVSGTTSNGDTGEIIALINRMTLIQRSKVIVMIDKMLNEESIT